jgi:hypothetical protein
MNNEQKNIAIAEMLGWKLGKKHLLPSETRWGDCWFDIDNNRRTGKENPLLFSIDANWQYEVLSYLLSLDIIMEDMEQYYSIVDLIPDREAVFEALYQFSQYLKTKEI